MTTRKLNVTGLKKAIAADCVVQYYAPWCGYCKQLASVYAQVADQAPSNVHVVRFNMDKHGAEVKAQNVGAGTPVAQDVRGFPTVIMYKKDGTRSVYTGPRNADAMLEAIHAHYNSHAPSPALRGGGGDVPWYEQRTEPYLRDSVKFTLMRNVDGKLQPPPPLDLSKEDLTAMENILYQCIHQFMTAERYTSFTYKKEDNLRLLCHKYDVASKKFISNPTTFVAADNDGIKKLAQVIMYIKSYIHPRFFLTTKKTSEDTIDIQCNVWNANYLPWAFGPHVTKTNA